MPKRQGIEVLERAFVHIERVRITCPLCGHVFTAAFQRLEPHEGFVIPGAVCTCGRYTYCHSVR
jgi:C4-type Zn-finger protein